MSDLSLSQPGGVTCPPELQAESPPLDGWILNCRHPFVALTADACRWASDFTLFLSFPSPTVTWPDGPPLELDDLALACAVDRQGTHADTPGADVDAAASEYLVLVRLG